LALRYNGDPATIGQAQRQAEAGDTATYYKDIVDFAIVLQHIVMRI
jgi:hypothetical protein